MANRLADETSPYLLQHAHNPVDWYPWGDEALSRAKAEDRPILLSVGYSACHWCHVMERESFEDPHVAALMNRWFVNVKVDREERPDLDSLYMQAVQAFSGGHGGWPMTVFLTPDGRPFFGGTYYPPTPRHGMPSFRQVLQHVHGVWEQQREKAVEVGDLLRERIQSAGRMPAAEGALRDDWLATIATAADAAYDENVPAWAPAPRFPRPWTIRALLAHHRRSGWPRSLEMATGVLDAMAVGGMYDVLGGGFARYSVDEAWRIPHFEKMLYDNAQLVPCYLEGWLVTGRERYRRIARETLDFVLAELRDDAGGFHSALDADSEGEEGIFYAWTPAELDEVLGEDAAWVAEHDQVTEAGTFEHGRSVIRPKTWPEDLDAADRARLDEAHAKLLAARATRVRPGLDDKVLTAWNGLMIGAFAKAGAVLGERRYLEAARQAADFLLTACTVDGRLMRTWKAGRARVPAFVDDHAFLADGLVELWCATGETRWLDAAGALADAMLALFWDDDKGGFFYVGSDAEELVARSKPLLGSAEPSGNGMAAWAFVRLAALTGRQDLEARADEVLRSLQQVVDRAPMALGPEALAAAWLTGPVQEVGLVGDADALEATLHATYEPFRVVARMRDRAAPIPWMAERLDVDGPRAFVCSRGSCQLPVGTPEDLAQQLAQLARPTEPEPEPLARPVAPELPTDPELWLNGSGLDLDALRGNVVVLDFWTYCCINCLHVLPELAAVEQAFYDQPVVVVGVHSAKFPAERERDNVARAVERHQIRHPVLLDGEHEVWKSFGVQSWPTVAVLDAEGHLAWARPGEVGRDELAEVVRGLLDEAREQGTLGQPAWRPDDPATHTEHLRHPGKVQAWPDEAAQAMGAPAFTPDTRLYVSDTGHHRVLELTVAKGGDGWPELRLTRTFGAGIGGWMDGPARLARFQEPQGVARDGDVLWVADTGNHCLRRIDLETGAITTAVGTGALGRGGLGNPDAPREMALRSPWDIAAVNGMVWIAMAGSHQIWVYLPEADRAGPFAGNGKEDHVDGTFQEASFAQPSGLALIGPWLFVADSEVSSIRALDLGERKVATLVGKGLFDFGDVDGVGEAVRLQHALGVTAAEGTVYVADTFNGKLKRIEPTQRRCTTLSTGFSEPGGLTVLGDVLVVADTNAHRLVGVHRGTGEQRALAISGL